MGRIFTRWMHGNMRPIWENLEGRWIFQVTLIKNGLYTFTLSTTFKQGLQIDKSTAYLNCDQ